MDKKYYEEKIKHTLKTLENVKGKYSIENCFEKYLDIIRKYEKDSQNQFNIETYKTKRKIEREPNIAIKEMQDDLKEIYYFIFKKII